MRRGGEIISAMRATEYDDPGFVARLRLGDPAAYRLLVRRFHASLVRFAASIIGSHAQAEEVVQDRGWRCTPGSAVSKGVRAS